MRRYSQRSRRPAGVVDDGGPDVDGPDIVAQNCKTWQIVQTRVIQSIDNFVKTIGDPAWIRLSDGNFNEVRLCQMQLADPGFF